MARQGGTFTVTKFPPDLVGDPGAVYHDPVTTGMYFEEAADIAVYERTLANATFRDSKLRNSPVLAMTSERGRAFLHAIKRGRFDR